MITYQNQEKTYYKVNCTKCGEETKVPFQPIDGKEILCTPCFRKKKQEEKEQSEEYSE